MTPNSKRKIAATLFLTMLLALLHFNAVAETPYDPFEGWKIPPPVLKIKNPLASDKADLRKGKVLYEKHCASCHGSSGRGDGTKAKDLENDPGDFTAPEFKEVPPGALFFMINEGQDEMKAFKKKLSDKEVWQVVLYLEQLN